MSELSNPFMSAGAKAKATQFCVGVLRNVQASKVSTKGTYYVVNFELESMGSGTSAKTRLLWHPEFFVQSYNPRADEERGRPFVYQNNFYTEHRGYNPLSSDRTDSQLVGLSTLQGMAGSEQKFFEIGHQLKEVFANTSDLDQFAEQFDATLRSLEGTTVGYILKQQWVDSGAKNDRGYAIKVPGKYYEVVGYFYPNSVEFSKIQKEVEKFTSKGKGQAYVCFDPSVPFDASYASEV